MNKKIMAILLLVALTTTFSGCIFGYSTSTPVDTVQSYFNALQSLDIIGLNGLVITSLQLDEDELDQLKDDSSNSTSFLRSWQVVITNRTIILLEQNNSIAMVNVSADLQISITVRGITETNQSRIQADFNLELIDSRWLISEYSGPDLLP